MTFLILVSAPEATVGWVTLEEARDLSADLAVLDDATLTLMLDAAHDACVRFLPVAEEYPARPSWKLAQVMQAKAIFNSQSAGRGDQLGVDGFTVTVFPLDWSVKQLLRPKRGKPGVL